ncbi:hypothetical protein BH10BAC3_BH10BAC3_43000 [soil metagenome]
MENSMHVFAESILANSQVVDESSDLFSTNEPDEKDEKDEEEEESDDTSETAEQDDPPLDPEIVHSPVTTQSGGKPQTTLP